MYLRNRILPYFILVAVVAVQGNDSTNLTNVNASGMTTESTTPGPSTLLTTFSSSNDSATPKETTTPSTASNGIVSAITTPSVTAMSVPTSSSVGVSSSTSSRSSTVSMPTSSSAAVPSSTSSTSSTDEGTMSISSTPMPTDSGDTLGSTVISSTITQVIPNSAVNSTSNIASSTPSTTDGVGVTSSTSSRSSTVIMPTSSSVGVPSSTSSTSDEGMTSVSSTPIPTESAAGDTLVAAIAGAGGAIILMIVIFIVIMSVVLIYVVMKTPKKKKDDSKWITGNELVDLNQLENEEENCRMGAGGTGDETKVESNMEGEKGSDDKDAPDSETIKVEKNSKGEKKQEEETTDKVEGSSSQPKEANSDEQQKTDTLATAGQNEKEISVPSNIDKPAVLTTGTEPSTPAKATTFVGSPSQTEAETESKKLEDLFSGDSSNQEKKTNASENGSTEPAVVSPTSVVASDQPKDVIPIVSGTEDEKDTSTKEEAAKDSKT